MFEDDLLGSETPPRWSFANQHGTPSILSALCAHHVLTVPETKQLLEKPKQYQIHQVSMSTNQVKMNVNIHQNHFLCFCLHVF